MPIWIIGMMGSGKTTVGRLVGTTLDREFRDTDLLIQNRLGDTIRRVWEQGGEELFRSTESAVIEELAQGGDWVVATGGGAVLHPGNRNAMRRSGTAVWLQATPKELGRRIGSVRGRPLLDVDDPVARLQELLEERTDLRLVLAVDVDPHQDGEVGLGSARRDEIAPDPIECRPLIR